MKLLNASELTWDELRREALRGSLFVLCVAPLEDHASHLPSGTDPIIIEALAKSVVKMVAPIPAEEAEKGMTRAVMLPTWYQGSSLLQSLGCLRWKASTVVQTLVEYGIQLERLGVRRLVFLTSHGAADHMKALEKAAKILGKQSRMNVLAPSGPMLNDFILGRYRKELVEWLGRPLTEREADDLKGDLHAAGWETSLILHIAPRLVSDTYRTLPSHSIFQGRKLKFRALRYHRGYFGSPAAASAELGEAVFKMLSHKSAQRIDEFMAEPLRADQKRRLPQRVKSKRRPRRKPSKSRFALNVAAGLCMGWVLFRALDRHDY